MITIKDWLELVDYRITETNHYGWACYGDHAQVFSYWDGSHAGVTTEIIYDLKTQVVYEVTAHDFMMEKSYRMINPKYKSLYQEEVGKRSDSDTAYDGVVYTDLEVHEDLLEKLTAILNYETYDTRVQVPLDLNRDEMHMIMTQAHEADMTLNEYAGHLLRRVVDDRNVKKSKKKKRKVKETI